NTEHGIIVFTEQIPFPIQARPQAEFPSAASLRLNPFSPVIIPAVCSGKNKVLYKEDSKNEIQEVCAGGTCPAGNHRLDNGL
ncbi:MAG: hypothetical protein IJC31_07885, partial [Spirochaetaceae bacterium]|nr:hypothetical protein [Spirochaetaceae bacterium]